MKITLILLILFPLVAQSMEAPPTKQINPNNMIKAAMWGDLEAVKVFLAAKVSPDSRNDEKAEDQLGTNPTAGNTALMNASSRGHLEIVKLLLAAGANPNLYNLTGKTALLLCNKHTHVMVELLKAKADPNIGDQNNGSTALMFAIMCRDLPRTRLLLTHKADPDQANRFHWNARGYAEEAGQDYIDAIERPIKPAAAEMIALDIIMPATLTKPAAAMDIDTQDQ